jgi:hypothetical protein
LLFQIEIKTAEKYNQDLPYDVLPELRDLYLRFFQTEYSLSYNTEDSILSYNASSDGLISVFNWDTAINSLWLTFDSLIQYRASNGKLKTVSIPQWFADNTKESVVAFDYEFNKPIKLKEDVYLLHGGNYNKYPVVIFTAIELKNDVIVPYNAFNGKSFLKFFIRVYWEYDSIMFPGVISRTVNFDEEPFSIELAALYQKDPKNYHNIDAGWLQADDFYKREETFVFNGTEFVGDYSIFLDF